MSKRKSDDFVFEDSKGKEWSIDDLKEVVEYLNKKYKIENGLEYYFKEDFDY